MITFKRDNSLHSLDRHNNNYDFTQPVESNKGFLIETEGTEFNGISGLTGKKKSINHNSEFMERF